MIQNTNTNCVFVANSPSYLYVSSLLCCFCCVRCCKLILLVDSFFLSYFVCLKDFGLEDKRKKKEKEELFCKRLINFIFSIIKAFCRKT